MCEVAPADDRDPLAKGPPGGGLEAPVPRASPGARGGHGIGPMARGPDRRRALNAGRRCLPAAAAEAGEDRRRLKGVSPAGKDLTVLAPPLLVCAAFVIAVGAFLRHEMGASRRRRDQDASDDISGDGTIPDTASSQASTQSDDEDASGAD